MYFADNFRSRNAFVKQTNAAFGLWDTGVQQIQ